MFLEIPDAFRTRRRGPQLLVYWPERERTRSPVDLSITVVDKEPSFPGKTSAKTKDVGGRSIHYLVTEEEGGSGGPGVRLRAWVESGGRFIVLHSVAQPDSGGDGDFLAEWAILPTLRWQSPKATLPASEKLRD